MNIRKPERRNKRVSVRMTPSQYAAVELVANRAEVTVSDLVREAADGLANAALVAGPALESLAEGSIEERLAALEVLRVQAEQYEVMGRQYRTNYETAKAALEAEQRAAAEAAQRAAS